MGTIGRIVKRSRVPVSGSERGLAWRADPPLGGGRPRAVFLGLVSCSLGFCYPARPFRQTQAVSLHILHFLTHFSVLLTHFSVAFCLAKGVGACIFFYDQMSGVCVSGSAFIRNVECLPPTVGLRFIPVLFHRTACYWPSGCAFGFHDGHCTFSVGMPSVVHVLLGCSSSDKQKSGNWWIAAPQ